MAQLPRPLKQWVGPKLQAVASSAAQPAGILETQLMQFRITAYQVRLAACSDQKESGSSFRGAHQFSLIA